MHVAAPRSGWQWLAEGLRLFRASPTRWTLLVVAYWMLIAVVNNVDYLGSILVAICLPGFSASFMLICEEARLGRPLRLALLFSGFQRYPRTIFLLGALYLAGISLVLAITTLADGGLLMNWLLFNRPPPESAILEGKLSTALLLAALLATPVLMAFWFAPVLSALEGMSASKALFYSFFACWRNWRALSVYFLAVTVFAIFIAMFVAIFAVVSGGNPNAARGFMLAATIMMMPTLFGSFYAAYVEIFPRVDAAEPPPAG